MNHICNAFEPLDYKKADGSDLCSSIKLVNWQVRLHDCIASECLSVIIETLVIFEIIIRKQIVAIHISKGYLNPTQHGFRGRRSCLSALLNVFDDIMHLMNGRNTIDMVYLDFATAFDQVDHKVLLHEIKTLGITGHHHHRVVKLVFSVFPHISLL